MRGKYSLEAGTLDGDVPPEAERSAAEDLVRHVALRGGHH
jgi:hypothetical protein